MSERIYVGYLPLTPGDRRFVVLGLVLLAAIVAAGAALSAREQRSPGNGHWDVEKLTKVTGVVRVDGAARIVVEAGEGSASPVTWFLVRPGKIGAESLLRPFDGRELTLEGYSLTRSGERMLELAGEPALENLAQANLIPPREREIVGERTFRGEIVDLKCYLGAMKPGDGRAHKACATLCVQGGIPAAMVGVRTDEPEDASPASPRCLLIRTRGGGPLPAEVMGRIGEPVEVRGVVEREGDFEWLIVDDASVQRTAGAAKWAELKTMVCVGK